MVEWMSMRMPAGGLFWAEIWHCFPSVTASDVHLFTLLLLRSPLRLPWLCFSFPPFLYFHNQDSLFFSASSPFLFFFLLFFLLRLLLLHFSLFPPVFVHLEPDAAYDKSSRFWWHSVPDFYRSCARYYLFTGIFGSSIRPFICSCFQYFLQENNPMGMLSYRRTRCTVLTPTAFPWTPTGLRVWHSYSTLQRFCASSVITKLFPCFNHKS